MTCKQRTVASSLLCDDRQEFWNINRLSCKSTPLCHQTFNENFTATLKTVESIPRYTKTQIRPPNHNYQFSYIMPTKDLNNSLLYIDRYHIYPDYRKQVDSPQSCWSHSFNFHMRSEINS